MLFDFAADHNLAIDEYYHESPSWSFRFRHPKGGAAAIEVDRLDDLTVRILGNWYIDEYETFTRHLKWGSKRDLLLNNIDLRKELETDLAAIVLWEKADMMPYSGYKESWSKYTKAEWDKMSVPKRIPTLRL